MTDDELKAVINTALGDESPFLIENGVQNRIERN